MILYVMLVALGFLIATLLALLIAPAFWRRAERLTARRLEQTMPMSIAEAEAERDQIRASYAIIIRRLEAALSQEKMRSARQLVKISRLQMQIADLNDKAHELRGRLDAEHNAASVLRRTIATRVPELNRAAQDARQLVSVRDREIDTIVNRLRHREQALAIAQRTTEMQQAEIARLRQAMEMSGSQNAGRFKLRPTEWTIHDYRAEYDRLNVELSKLRERLSVAYDREANQIKELRTELQHLADQIVSTASVLPEGEPQRAITHEPRSDDHRRLRAPADRADDHMRSIDAIISDAAGSARTPAVDRAARSARTAGPGSALTRAVAAPRRLARGAIRRVAGLAGVTREAMNDAVSGRGRQPDAAPMPGEVSAARLLGGAAVSERQADVVGSGQSREALTKPSAPQPAIGSSDRDPAPKAPEPPRALSDMLEPAAAPETKPAADHPATEGAPADAPDGQPGSPENAPARGSAPARSAETPGDDGSLYDRYRSAQPISGKLADSPAEAGKAVESETEHSQSSASPRHTEDSTARPDSADEGHRQDTDRSSVSAGNGADAADTDASADKEASPGSLLDRLRQVPESETR